MSAVTEPVGWLSELIKASPAMAAVIVIVFLFIRHLERMNQSADLRFSRELEMDVARSSTLKDIGQSCHIFQEGVVGRIEKVNEKMVEALDRNSVALTKTEVELARHTKRS